MLPNCSRLGLGALSTRVVSTVAGPAGDAVFTTPELVAHILQSIKDGDPKEACNSAHSWCNRTKGNKAMCSDANDIGWSAVTEQVFEDYAAPQEYEAYVHSPPETYTAKGWFQELCGRHGRVLGQIKRVHYYSSRFYNTEAEVTRLRQLIQTFGVQVSDDVRSMHEMLTRLGATRDRHREENEAQKRLRNMMHETFFSDDGLYFSDEIFADGMYKGLNALDTEVFRKPRTT